MKNIVIIFILSLFSHFSYTQDIIDPYETDYPTIPNLFNYQFHPFVISNSFNPVAAVFDSDDRRSINGGYTGEYMISLNHLHWNIAWSTNTNSFYPSSWANNAKTYKMEVVSFPFTCNCYNDATGCAYPVSPIDKRRLYMPEDNYDFSTQSWGDIKNTRLNGLFTNSGPGAPISGADGLPDNLVSDNFHSNYPANNGTRTLLPHTAIKHTIYLHCTNSITSAITDSIVWIYDNTRGRMRYYPFVSQNSSIGSSTDWDVVYMPELITKPYTADPLLLGVNYSNSSNNDWFEGGTIDYLGFNNGSTAPCNPGATTTYFPLSSASPFAESYYNSYTLRTQYEFYNGSPAPYSLYTTYLRNNIGTIPVGYEINNGNLTIPLTKQGIKHEYYIDRGYPLFDLTVINPNEKIIYNPSEVSVIADAATGGVNNVIFPTGYTFKTILGRYPSMKEVQEANTIANGGPYIDYKNVPVPVNANELMPVSGNPIDYPTVSWDDLSPTSLIDERFGYYYIENLGRITVEPCVKIFDVIFQANPGGTLLFEEYPSVKNPARFKSLAMGGAVLKNYSNIQYVQNGIITQPYPLIYIAQDEIFSGQQVDPDINVPIGSYSIEPGANVTFRAANAIKLEDGFHAKNGSAFKAHCPTILYSPCTTTSAGSRNSVALTSLQSPENIITQEQLIVSPNPGTRIFKVEVKNNIGNYFISITDIFGRKILEQNSNPGYLLFDIGNQPKGMYIVTAKTSQKQWVEKIIKL